MSIVGYAAAQGIFLDIHPLLRALAQSLQLEDGSKVRLSTEMLEEVKRMPDPEDATEIIKEYYQAWWTQSQDWKMREPPVVDMWTAVESHIRVRFC